MLILPGALLHLLPHKDTQFVLAAGQAHIGPVGTSRHRFFHVIQAFRSMPPRKDADAETPGGY